MATAEPAVNVFLQPTMYEHSQVTSKRFHRAAWNASAD